MNRDIHREFVESTRVTFRHLDLEEIHRYVQTGSSLDKAGAYGLQDQEMNFVQNIEGSYTNVVGLPIERLRDLLISELSDGNCVD